MTSSPKRIFITGASSGIGRALALEYAASGVVIGLAARRRELLEALADEIKQKGAHALVFELDVTDPSAVEATALAFIKEAGGCDLAVANAGIGWNVIKSRYHEADKLTEVIEVNLNGVIHTLAAFLPSMLSNRSGHLAAIGSVAGFRGLPSGSYSAAKAAVKTMMDTWRVAYHGRGIKFTTICPGFIDTPILDNMDRKALFIVSAERTAVLIRRAIERNKKTAVVPWFWNLIIPWMKLAPDWLLARFTAKG